MPYFTLANRLFTAFSVLAEEDIMQPKLVKYWTLPMVEEWQLSCGDYRWKKSVLLKFTSRPNIPDTSVKQNLFICGEHILYEAIETTSLANRNSLTSYSNIVEWDNSHLWLNRLLSLSQRILTPSSSSISAVACLSSKTKNTENSVWVNTLSYFVSFLMRNGRQFLSSSDSKHEKNTAGLTQRVPIWWMHLTQWSGWDSEKFWKIWGVL